jgi:molybdate transport system substrate-binding protein
LKRHARAIFLALAGLLLAVGTSAARAADITVFAAASLSGALNDAGASWHQKTGHTANFSFAASSNLAKQIEASAYADIFISADTDWMDYLDKKGLIATGTRVDLLGNHLVLIAPSGLKIALRIAPHFALAAALGNGRLSVADPGSVPAGKYAKAALIALGVWNDVADHLAPAENVRVALSYVARGETPLGIVYATDARAEPKVRVVDTFPDDTHPRIVYPAALTRDAKPLATDFLAFLRGSAARAIFEKDGFVVLQGAAPLSP